MVELINAVLCPSCDGTGQKPGPDDSLSICKSCNGKGMLRKDKNTNEIIGTLITLEKYTFADKNLIADVVREVAKLINTKQKGTK